MGDYKWKSFSEVDHLATSFGKGLRELGNKPRENVVIFAETRAEWMISAHGCFKQSIPGKYIYNSQLKNLNTTSDFRVGKFFESNWRCNSRDINFSEKMTEMWKRLGRNMF